MWTFWLPIKTSTELKDWRLTSPRSSSPKLYLQAALRTETKVLKLLLQFVAVSLSLFVVWSRIADNKHFLTDVLAGFVLGAIFAWFVVSQALHLLWSKLISTTLAEAKFAHALYTHISTARFWCKINTPGLKDNIENFSRFHCIVILGSTWVQTRGGGALGYFLGGYMPPGTPNWHHVLKIIRPKIDTPF